jgi:hypothetical protein
MGTRAISADCVAHASRDGKVRDMAVAVETNGIAPIEQAYLAELIPKMHDVDDLETDNVQGIARKYRAQGLAVVDRVVSAMGVSDAYFVDALNRDIRDGKPSPFALANAGS